jgi:hypothetical protein
MKSTKAEVMQRVEEILAIRLSGAEFWDVREYAREKAWGVSDGQLYRYIAQADELIAQSLEKDRNKLLNRALAQRRALLARTMQVSDYRTALSILKDEADLCGLYPPAKHEHTGKDGKPIQTDAAVKIYLPDNGRDRDTDDEPTDNPAATGSPGCVSPDTGGHSDLRGGRRDRGRPGAS